MKTTAIKNLNIPGSPEDLLDMYELRDRILLQKQLNDNIIDYIRNYHNSFLKNHRELEKILPDHTINEYHIQWLNQLNSNEKDDNYKWKYECELQFNTLYLTNFKDRIIYNCYPIHENNRKFYYEQKENILLVRQIFEKHSTFSRSYNPQLLYDLYHHEAIPIGRLRASKKTIDMLSKWSDKIIIMQPHMLESVDKKYHDKVICVDVGEDRFGIYIHPELLDMTKQAGEWLHNNIK